jgi:hypothetical protein
LNTRLDEHKKACEKADATIQPNNKNDNGIPYHYATTGHVFQFEKTQILERERNHFRRKILEGIHITISKDSYVNIIGGQRVDKCWNALIYDL